MITNNLKNEVLSLVAFKKGDVNNIFLEDIGETTLSSKDKKLYICLKKGLEIRRLKSILEKFVKTNKYCLNINLESFLDVLGDEPKYFQAVVETMMYWNQPMFSLKTSTNDNLNFKFIFDSKWNKLFEEIKIKAEFVNFARDLQNLPPNLGTSIKISELIEDKAKTIPGLELRIYNKKQIEDLQMGLFLAVNSGSIIEPRLVVLKYCSDESLPRTALVGKGITFDTGGYNLKSSNYIKDMKFDMTGAAVVCGSVMALARANAKCNVVAVALLTDNCIGETAMLPESVYKSMSGKTVEITNTDAEGRLVLADGVTYAIQKCKAKRILTAATLTGAIRIALGRWYVGMFTNSDKLSQEFLASNERAQEFSWRLPLLEEHLEVMQTSKIADLVNSEDGSEAGSSTAAAFLESFAEKNDFLHVDLSGVGRLNSEGTAPMLKSFFELLK